MKHLQQMQAMFDQLFDAGQAKPSHDLARLLPSEWLSESVKKSVTESADDRLKITQQGAV